MVKEQISKEELIKSLEGDHILYGDPKSDTFCQYQLRHKVSELGKDYINKYIDRKIKPHMKENEVILNTNL